MVEESMAAVIEYFASAPFPHFTVVQELLRPVSPRHNYNYSMEHLLSATFYLSDERGITSQTESAEMERTRFNYAHHFAHAWIPKRLSGKGYRPFNWELAPVLDTIWFSEGFAQYLAMAALADQLPEADRAEYLDNLIQGRFRDNLDGAPLFSKKMSLTELSHSASTLSSQDFRTLRHVSSRGGMIAAEMDALIREQSGGTRTLRDGLRYLMHWSEQERRPLDMEELPEILQQAVGVDTRSILQDWKKPMVN
jgi:predicted metalloprotease with PDZ domain